MAVVGLVDSGSGGLSVYREIRKLLPEERFIYYADNAHCPYGEKSAEYIADHFGAPPIPLAAFEPPLSLFKPYPEQTLRLRGAVPFAKLGNVTLIAMVNPTDAALKTVLESVGPCRFYLADPSAVEALLDKVYGASGGGGGA